MTPEVPEDDTPLAGAPPDPTQAEQEADAARLRVAELATVAAKRRSAAFALLAELRRSCDTSRFEVALRQFLSAQDEVARQRDLVAHLEQAALFERLCDIELRASDDRFQQANLEAQRADKLFDKVLHLSDLLGQLGERFGHCPCGGSDVRHQHRWWLAKQSDKPTLTSHPT